MPPHPLAAGFTLALTLGLSGTAAAQGTAPKDAAPEALAQPMSPGAVALLLQHSAAPETPRRLIEALEDPRAEVRGIAARVAFTTRHAAVAPALEAALDRESNAAAAAEIVRALALIRGAAADDRIARRLPEFDSRATLAWVSTLVRSRPADVWARLADIQLTEAQTGAALAHLVEADPKAAQAAFAALPQAPRLATAYRAALTSLRGTLPSWPILESGLSAAWTRDAVLQLLVTREASGHPVPAEAGPALALVDRSPALAWLALYRELVRRGQSPAPPRQAQLDTILRIDPTTLPAGFLEDSILARLDAKETAALRQLVGPDWVPFVMPPSSSAPASAPPVRPVTVEPTLAADGSMTRLARPQSSDLMKDLQALLGCRPVDGNVAVVDVTYRPTGQVRGVVTTTAVDPDGCNQVAAIVAALDVAPGGVPIREGRVDRLVIGLRPTDVGCDRAPVAEAPPERVGRRLTAPKKTRNVVPVYPNHLIADRVQGLLLAEALISTSGCVVDAVVRRRVHADLDVAALAAIGQWRYEPALLNGAAVPVVMTVTVNFALR